MTEPAVQRPARTHARSGLASTIGTSITSGGTGKNELSAKAVAKSPAPA